MPVVLTLAALIFLTPARAEACSCMGGGAPCQAAFTGRAVFTGSVTAIRDTSNLRMVTMRVERRWRVDHNALPADIITVETGQGGGDCGYPFDVGERYLVYADRSPTSGLLHANICSRTRRLADAGDDLSYFAALESGVSTSRIFGQLRAYNEADPRPAVAGIPIELRGGSSLRTTVTDADGRFEFPDVTAGGYEVSARLPPTVVPARSRAPIGLARGGCAQVDLVARWDGRIAGALLRANGTAAGILTLEAHREGDRFPHHAATDGSGAFVFAGLPPGRYAIGTSLTSPPRPDRPYATQAMRAEIALGPGEHVSVGTLDAPEALREIALIGSVRLKTGGPPLDARINVAPIWEGRPFVATVVPVAADGSYRVMLFEDTEYEISVGWRGGYYMVGRFVGGRSTLPDPLIVAVP